MASIDSNSPQYIKLSRESIQYDYALLKLKTNIQRDSFPALFSDFSTFVEEVTVCGYLNEKFTNNAKRDIYKQSFHANPLEEPLGKAAVLFILC